MTQTEAYIPRDLRVADAIKHGCRIQDGDEYQDPHTGKWHPSKCVGKPIGIKHCTNLIYRRKKA